VARIEAELSAVGIAVRRVPVLAGADVEAVVTAAMAEGASAAIRVIPRSRGTEVWNSDTTARVLRRSAIRSESSDAALAVLAFRTVEFLRASLLEVPRAEAPAASRGPDQRAAPGTPEKAAGLPKLASAPPPPPAPPAAAPPAPASAPAATRASAPTRGPATAPPVAPVLAVAPPRPPPATAPVTVEVDETPSPASPPEPTDGPSGGPPGPSSPGVAREVPASESPLRAGATEAEPVLPAEPVLRASGRPRPPDRPSPPRLDLDVGLAWLVGSRQLGPAPEYNVAIRYRLGRLVALGPEGLLPITTRSLSSKEGTSAIALLRVGLSLQIELPALAAARAPSIRWRAALGVGALRASARGTDPVHGLGRTATTWTSSAAASLGPSVRLAPWLLGRIDITVGLVAQHLTIYHGASQVGSFGPLYGAAAAGLQATW
jgi:hypothetical protein